MTAKLHDVKLKTVICVSYNIKRKLMRKIKGAVLCSYFLVHHHTQATFYLKQTTKLLIGDDGQSTIWLHPQLLNKPSTKISHDAAA